MAQPFSLQKRKNTKGKTIYYVQFWDEERGKYGTAKSSGQSNRVAATRWAEQIAIDGTVEQRTPSLSDYAREFFSPDGRYVRSQASKGRQKTIAHLSNQDAYVRNHIGPFFASTKLSAVDTPLIDDFTSWLFDKGLSGSTINHIIHSLQIILKWAHRDKIVRRMPDIETVRLNAGRRGTLTNEEAVRLLSLPDWPLNHLAINWILYTTGIRLGECLALRYGDVDFEMNTLSIDHSWSREQGLKGTKTNSSRVVPMIAKVRALITAIQTEGGRKDQNSFLFPGRGPNIPIDRKAVYKYFVKQLDRIGISVTIAKERGIVLHSYRHLANSNMVNAGIPQMKVRALTGHRSEAMTQNYYHVDTLKEVSELLEKQTQEIPVPKLK